MRLHGKQKNPYLGVTSSTPDASVDADGDGTDVNNPYPPLPNEINDNPNSFSVPDGQIALNIRALVDDKKIGATGFEPYIKWFKPEVYELETNETENKFKVFLLESKYQEIIDAAGPSTFMTPVDIAAGEQTSLSSRSSQNHKNYPYITFYPEHLYLTDRNDEKPAWDLFGQKSAWPSAMYSWFI